MPSRLRFYDARLSRLPRVLGLCADNRVELANYINSAQRRLIYAKEAGDEGWYGTWAEIAFNVSRTSPYFTAPREIARLVAVNVCERPVRINNQFVEYLDFGNGRLPKTFQTCQRPNVIEAFTRNVVPTFVDLTAPPQILRVYATEPADLETSKRVLLQGTDNNGIPIRTQDGFNQVDGAFVFLTTPFISPPMQFNTLTGIQKDVTTGQVNIYQADPTTGDEILLLTMQPTETTAAYRRYYFSDLPASCCFTATTPQGSVQTLTLTAIAKLELIPVMVDTDYLLIQNLEAIIEECQSIRYSEIDTPAAKQMAQEKHMQAIRLLMGELGHYLGIDDPAVMFAPFGSARLEKLKIGSMI